MATPSLHPLLHYLRRLSGGPTGASDLDDAQLLRRFLGQLPGGRGSNHANRLRWQASW